MFSLCLPYKFFDGVVKVEAELIASLRKIFGACELELVDEIFVAHLGETFALLGVKVEVVNPKLSLSQIARVVVRIIVIRKFNCEFNFVVLKSDKRKRKPSVTIEPELKWDVRITKTSGCYFVAGRGCGGVGRPAVPRISE